MTDDERLPAPDPNAIAEVRRLLPYLQPDPDPLRAEGTDEELDQVVMPLAPARGCAIGLLIAGVVWAIVLAALVWRLTGG